MKMKISKSCANKVSALLLLIILSGASFAVGIENGIEIEKRQGYSNSIVKQVMAIEKERIIQRAEKLLNEKPRTVTASSSPRSMGGKHDFSSKEITQIKAWFSQFIAWLTTHPYGIDEMSAKNNHGTWWHAQVASYARLVGDEKVLQLCRNHYQKIILPNQMASNGSFPEELARTKPYSYSLFNLDATAALLWILSDKTFSDWNFKLQDGRGLKKGLEFMLPFLRDKTEWTGGKDVDHWDGQPEARQFMLFASLAGNDPKWFNLWKSLGEKNSSDESRLSMMIKNPIIWISVNNNGLIQ